MIFAMRVVTNISITASIVGGLRNIAIVCSSDAAQIADEMGTVLGPDPLHRLKFASRFGQQCFKLGALVPVHLAVRQVLETLNVLSNHGAPADRYGKYSD